MRRLVLLFVGVLVGATALEAHHSIAAVYDGDRSVTIEGTVIVFRFVNPHPSLGLEVTGEDGATETWQLEMDNLRELAREGMTAETLRPGDRVILTSNPSRIAPRTLYVRRLDRPGDGFWYEEVGFSPRVGGLD